MCSSDLVATANQPFGGDDGIGGYAPLAVAAISGVNTTAINWVHGNHLGVPLVTTDATGTAVIPTGYTLPGFPGQTRTLNDLYYNRYRDYDPSIGRYVQADPIGLEGDVNPYLYAMGNPVTGTDPLGLGPVGRAIGGTIGGLGGGAAAGAVCIETGPGAIACGMAGRAAGRAAGGAIGSAIEDALKGAPKNDCDCEKEWAEARQKCAELIASGKGPYIKGGYHDIYQCARGLVSVRCGGNEIRERRYTPPPATRGRRRK